ncbi:MAG: hypothetical protein GX800_00320 [Clostridiaceae bacterium]|nr:hypothetical protein [Clostridiaceae bacterium]
MNRNIWQILIFMTAKTSKKIKEIILIYFIGATGYALLEILWRGYTHWTMAVTGGLCFLIIYKADTKLANRNIITKCTIYALIVTCAELIVGTVVNLRLKWNVWDYSSLPYNYLGQICIVYSALWFALGFPLSSLCKRLMLIFDKKAKDAAIRYE